MGFWTGKKVLVTGGNGFFGRHVVAALGSAGCSDIFVAKSNEYDLTHESNVERLFDDSHPQYVFHLAGLVGGILPNKERPADFFYNNLMMGTLMFHYSWKNGVKKFIAAGAGCGYPENAPLPLKEESFWDGYPQKESAPYSLAKRLLTIQSMAYQKQHGFPSVICVPGNLYGPWDNFNLLDAHVIPALVRKFVEAADSKAAAVEVWGSGRASRDYMYAGDAADGMLKAAETYQQSTVVNLSSGIETDVKSICGILREVAGFGGDIKWNTSRPDGQLRRCFDVSKARRELSFAAKTDIRNGIENTVRWYRENLNNPALRK
ncbi:MAG: hypothetical protein A2583_04730 [Bdellovibrionales bacterium RIFOXYD1_FULL_53_11]|nr:MAG: hypothetical protein A2583_04730 [Bdellovibrionales bacterium RIFOXYD1_FULL_53_11]